MKITSNIERVTSTKFIIRDEEGHEICRVVPTSSVSLSKGRSKSLAIAKFVSDSINFYSQRCDDSEIPRFNRADEE